MEFIRQIKWLTDKNNRYVLWEPSKEKRMELAGNSRFWQWFFLQKIPKHQFFPRFMQTYCPFDRWCLFLYKHWQKRIETKGFENKRGYGKGIYMLYNKPEWDAEYNMLRERKFQSRKLFFPKVMRSGLHDTVSSLIVQMTIKGICLHNYQIIMQYRRKSAHVAWQTREKLFRAGGEFVREKERKMLENYMKETFGFEYEYDGRLVFLHEGYYIQTGEMEKSGTILKTCGKFFIKQRIVKNKKGMYEKTIFKEKFSECTLEDGVGVMYNPEKVKCIVPRNPQETDCEYRKRLIMKAKEILEAERCYRMSNEFESIVKELYKENSYENALAYLGKNELYFDILY